ncbi:MAG: metal ABC transporter substrate-binding protein [Promethearchaeia archaeon]
MKFTIYRKYCESYQRKMVIIIKSREKLTIFGVLIGVLLLNPILLNNGNTTPAGILHKEDNNIFASDTSKKVVTANTILQDIAENVVGEEVDVVVSGAEDPHSYEPSSSEVEALEEADVIFRLGLEKIEPWWETEWESGATVIELVDADMLKVDPLLDVENPHVWMDPHNLINFTRQINSTMESEDPENTNTFRSNADNYISNLNDLISDINEARNKIKGTKVIVNHPAFFYLFELLEIDRIAAIEKGEGKEPSAEDITEIMKQAKEKNADLVVANPQHQSENVYEVARESDLKIALLTPLLNVEVEWDGETKIIDTYQKMIDYDLWAFQNPSNPPDLLWPIYIVLGLVVAGIIGVFLYLRRR